MGTPTLCNRVKDKEKPFHTFVASRVFICITLPFYVIYAVGPFQLPDIDILKQDPGAFPFQASTHPSILTVKSVQTIFNRISQRPHPNL